MGYLAGSRALLSQYLQSHPAPKTEGAAVEQEREELRAALVTAQESAAMQILLEVCVPTAQDKVRKQRLPLFSFKPVHFAVQFQTVSVGNLFGYHLIILCSLPLHK